MVIPASCKNIINRERITERCEPDLGEMPLNQQVHYMQQSCYYLVDTIIQLLYLIKQLEDQPSQDPSGGP